MNALILTKDKALAVEKVLYKILHMSHLLLSTNWAIADLREEDNEHKALKLYNDFDDVQKIYLWSLSYLINDSDNKKDIYELDEFLKNANFVEDGYLNQSKTKFWKNIALESELAKIVLNMFKSNLRQGNYSKLLSSMNMKAYEFNDLIIKLKESASAY